MKQLWKAALVAVLVMSAGAVQAQSEPVNAEVQRFVSSLEWRDGEIAVPGADARFRLGPQFRYLGQADARRVLEQLWGNPPDEGVLGLVIPRGRGVIDRKGWAVVVTYAEEGHVSDEDAAKIDYAGMLADMQAETRDENAARAEAGYETVDLIGWAEPPHYDATSKKLYWAKELAFGGNEQHTLNYDIRVLGRRGYLSLNAIAGIDQLDEVKSGVQQLLPMVEFDQGARYADYDSSTDKVAAYGLAALVGGGLAAKAGLFAKLGVLLLAGKKFLVLLLIPLAALVRRFFGRSKDRAGTVQ